MKTEAYHVNLSRRVSIDCYTETGGKAGGTCLDLDEAFRARQLLVDLAELIPAKDYFDLIVQLDKAMTEIDQARLRTYRDPVEAEILLRCQRAVGEIG